MIRFVYSFVYVDYIHVLSIRLGNNQLKIK